MADDATWYLARAGQQFGPYTQAQLRQMAAQGQLQPTDLVWQQGMSQWVQAQTRPDLFPVGTLEGSSPLGPAAPGIDFGPLWQAVQLHVRRAFAWNISYVEITPEEKTLLSAQRLDDEAAQRYLVWRRSVLWVLVIPTAVTALLGLIGAVHAGDTGNTDISLSALGILVTMISTLGYLLMPATAVGAALTWARPKMSRFILVGGWVIAFLLPLLLALFPLEWMYDFKAATAEDRRAIGFLFGVLGGIAYYITLMPTVLALLPGVVRACLRVKSLVPASIVPGWFLVGATPLYMLLFLVTFIVINQLFGNALLLLGVLCLMGAPVVFLVYAQALVRPLTSAEEVNLLGIIQWVYRGVAWFGVFLLVLYVLTVSISLPAGPGRFVEFSAIGTDERTSLLRPWSRAVWQFPIEYLSRSMFTTTVVAELFMVVNLSVWQQMRRFAGTPQAEAYDRMMDRLDRSL